MLDQCHTVAEPCEGLGESFYFYISLTFQIAMHPPVDDELIDALEAELPASNCGGCGFSGCRSFAEIVAGSGTTHGFLCSVGGHEVMNRLHRIMRSRNG